VEVCRVKGWELHALNVRTNHLHLVVHANAAPELVMNTCKAWATRRLREQRLIAGDGRVWARHGSTPPLKGATAVANAIEYVLNKQGADLGGVRRGNV
jgi:REP element-mobilizing transposase RayT